MSKTLNGIDADQLRSTVSAIKEKPNLVHSQISWNNELVNDEHSSTPGVMRHKLRNWRMI